MGALCLAPLSRACPHPSLPPVGEGAKRGKGMVVSGAAPVQTGAQNTLKQPFSSVQCVDTPKPASRSSASKLAGCHL